MANHNGVYYSSSSGLNLRTNATTRINISTGGVIQFNSAYTFPTSDGSANTVLLTNGSGALSFGTVPNAGLTNSSLTVTAGSGLANGGSVSLGGSVTLNVGAGTGIQVNADSVQLDYAGTNNFIDSATNLEGTAIAAGDTIVYHDATDNNVKKGFVSDLPFSNNSGTVTSVAISGSDGIDVDSGSPITTSGTIALGLSNVPNSSLANSSVTVGSTAISLGGTSTTLAGLTSLTTQTLSATGNATISGNLTVDTKTLYVDSTNNRVGINTTSPAYQFEIENTGANALLVLDRTDGAGCFIEGQATRSAFGSVGATPLVLAYNSLAVIEIGVGGAITVNPDGGNPFTFPTSDGTNGQVLATDGSGNVDWTSVTNGTVTSVAISGTDGIDVDSGSPITTSGTITLGLSNVPNAALANSSVTIGSTAISLGGTSTTLAGLTSVAATTFTGALSGNASTASKWASARTITLGTDLSGSVSIDGSANVSLNASIVAGAVGSTELATNAVTTVKITDGNVTNAKLANSSFTVNAPSGTDPVIPLGGTFNLTSSDSSVTISGNSTSDTIDLKVAGSVNTYVTGGTFTSGTLSLELNDGSSAQDISGFWSSIPNSALANSSVTVTAGNGLANGGSVSLGGSVTLNVGAAIGGGISVGANDISLDTSSSRNVDHDSVSVLAGTGLSGGGTISVNRTLALDTTNTRNVDHASVSISAGTGLSGGGTIAANRTISLDYAGTDNFIDSATNLEGTAISTSDTIIYHDATDNNVKKGLVSDLPFTNTSGTVTSVAITGTDGIDVDSGSPITSSGTITLGLSNVPNASLANSSVTVTAGNGLANGGSVSLGGSVTLNVGSGTGIQVNANDVALDYSGTDNFIDSATNLEGTDISGLDTIVYHDATDNNVKKGLVSDLPFTDNVGTVTSVGITAGALIDVTNSPITSNGNITVAVDLSELTTSTANGDGDYFAVVDTANAQKKLTKANILLSGFNDDISLYKNNGSLTSARTVAQAGYNMGFGANVNEQTLVYKTTSTSNTISRMFIEADDNYMNVLELYGSAPSAALVEGYDAGQASVFRVDNMGNLTAVSKAFDIPHPNPEKKAEGMRLKHGNLEGPEHGVYVRGRQIDDKEIELPEYWRDLVDPDSITVQLTSVGSHQNLYVKKIEDNVVYIGNGNLFSNKIDCYYFIQAERKDIDKIVVEYQR